jgi:hypothetical protein
MKYMNNCASVWYLSEFLYTFLGGISAWVVKESSSDYISSVILKSSKLIYDLVDDYREFYVYVHMNDEKRLSSSD